MTETSSPLLSIRDLQVTFVTRERTVHAVNGVSFDLKRGEVLSILGESGSGKSVTLRAVQRLLPERHTRISGEIDVDGEDVLAMSGPRLRDLRTAHADSDAGTCLAPARPWTSDQCCAPSLLC